MTPRSPRAWREYGIQPSRSETFTFSTDPQLVAKVTDVVGLYLAPPTNAIVLRATYKTVQVRDWLDTNPRITVHSTPSTGSWVNVVEVWFGIIERPVIHRGSPGSVKDRNAKIRVFINAWDDRRHPFVWTTTAEDVLDQSKRALAAGLDGAQWCGDRGGGVRPGRSAD